MISLYTIKLSAMIDSFPGEFFYNKKISKKDSFFAKGKDFPLIFSLDFSLYSLVTQIWIR